MSKVNGIEQHAQLSRSHAPLQMTAKSRFDLRNNLCLLACTLVWQPSEKNIVEVKDVNSVTCRCVTVTCW